MTTPSRSFLSRLRWRPMLLSSDDVAAVRAARRRRATEPDRLDQLRASVARQKEAATDSVGAILDRLESVRTPVKPVTGRTTRTVVDA